MKVDDWEKNPPTELRKIGESPIDCISWLRLVLNLSWWWLEVPELFWGEDKHGNPSYIVKTGHADPDHLKHMTVSGIEEREREMGRG